MGGVIVCKEYAIIVSWIDCNTQQLMEDLALEVQRETKSILLLVLSFYTLFGVVFASSQFVLLYGSVAQVFIYIYIHIQKMDVDSLPVFISEVIIH